MMTPVIRPEKYQLQLALPDIGGLLAERLRLLPSGLLRCLAKSCAMRRELHVVYCGWHYPAKLVNARIVQRIN